MLSVLQAVIDCWLQSVLHTLVTLFHRQVGSLLHAAAVWYAFAQRGEHCDRVGEADALKRQSTFARQLVWYADCGLLVFKSPIWPQARTHDDDDVSHMHAAVPAQDTCELYRTAHLVTHVDVSSRSQNEFDLHCATLLSEHFSMQVLEAETQSQVESPMH